ncbi:hypothetical protein BGZ49_000977 [Haplosporangium sp. Z 27]|nr:hypothetical protein BGZ49_000977 [Haplosporangium sp. Z 27]
MYGAATSSPLCSYTPTIAPPNSDTTSHPSILSTPVTNIEVSSKDVISAKLDPSTVTVSRFPQQSEQQPSPLPEPLSYPALSFSPDSRPHQETELDSYSSSSFVDRCSGHTNFSQSVPTDLVTLQSNDPSHKDSPCTTVPPSIPPASSSHPTPIESTVTITTSEVGSSDISQKEFYLSREIEYQSRSRAQNVRPSISGTVVQPLSPDSQKEGLSIPSNTKTQVLSSLDYLEYLEFCLASEQEQKALKRSQRPKSWIAVENFCTADRSITAIIIILTASVRTYLTPNKVIIICTFCKCHTLVVGITTGKQDV